MKYFVQGTIEAESDEEVRNLFSNNVSVRIETAIFHVHISNGSLQWHMNFAVNDKGQYLHHTAEMFNDMGFSYYRHPNDISEARFTKGAMRLSITSNVEGPYFEINKDFEIMSGKIKSFVQDFLDYDLRVAASLNVNT